VTTYLLDTNICVYLINKQPKQVLRQLQKRDIFEVGISSITLCELELGIYKSTKPLRNRRALYEFLSPLKIHSFNDSAAQAYGKIRWDLAQRGQTIGGLDTLIAAHALSGGWVLVTNNEKEFRRVSGLKIENWAN